MTSRFALAQLNIGRARAPMDSPTMAGFADGLARINALADAAPGFVWRLQTDSGDATDIRPFGDADILVNMSVWQDVDALQRYVYQSEHVDFLRRRREWFEPMSAASIVLWWVPAGHTPTIHEGIERLERLRRDGPGPHAFGFRSVHPAPDALAAPEAGQHEARSAQHASAAPSASVIEWLLDADPALRWQVMRDLLGTPRDEVAAERARIATQGLGARLLALQDAGGCWGGAAWNRGWTSTMHVLMLLRELGVDPDGEQARSAVARVRDHVTWKGCGPLACANNGFFAGEVEPCINGQVAMVGAYFGQDVNGLVDRLLSEQLPDGGWNCEAEHGSTRSSFHTTICVLEALLEVEQHAGPRSDVTVARQRGQHYLLERRLFRRLSTGEAIARDRKPGPGPAHDAPAFTRLAFPSWWHYDVLRGLEYLRRAGVTPDQRMRDAVDLVASKRNEEGRWPLELMYPGEMPVALDAGVGSPSRWNTLRALRVARWFHGERR